MHRRKQPFQLKTLAMAAVDSYIKNVFYLCEDQGPMSVSKILSNVSVTIFSSVPRDLSDEIATSALKSLNKLLRNAKYGVCSHRSILNTLTATITALHVKRCYLMSWPTIMHYFLRKNLYRLEGLEKLYICSVSYYMDNICDSNRSFWNPSDWKLSDWRTSVWNTSDDWDLNKWNTSDWNTSEAEKDIVRAVCSMSHLKALYLSLVCTDQILRAVGDTCHSLQILNATFSHSVTDQSISALLCCSQLQKLILYRTSITAGGFKMLLDGLPKLQDLGRIHEFENVLELLAQEPNNRFHNLRKVFCCDMSGRNLQMLVRQFPLLSWFELTRNHYGADLVILSAVHNLTELMLYNYDFFADHIDDLLQLSGPKLTLLNLSRVQIDLNGLVFISQHCPHLVTFSLNCCKLLDHAGLHNACPTEPAFPCLESLELGGYVCSQTHLKFLLSNCCNIRFICLDFDEVLTDAVMSTVFTRNQMKQLEELCILGHSNLSLKTVQLLMQHCDKLKLLSDFLHWKGISSEELAGLRNYIRENNLDLDLE